MLPMSKNQARDQLLNFNYRAKREKPTEGTFFEGDAYPSHSTYLKCERLERHRLPVPPVAPDRPHGMVH